MLGLFKRLFKRGGTPAGWADVEAWAAAQQFGFRRVPGVGFVVDGSTQGAVQGQGAVRPWRLEWGPSQRVFVAGHEMRWRAELAVSPRLQAMLMNRELQLQLEDTLFGQYVAGAQTHMDNQTPPEMRWLVVHRQLGESEMGDLASRYVAVASKPLWMQRWLQGAFGQALLAHAVNAAVPLVFSLNRGRLTLRTEMPLIALADIERWRSLFEVALHQALLAQALLPADSPAESPAESPADSAALRAEPLVKVAVNKAPEAVAQATESSAAPQAQASPA